MAHAEVVFSSSGLAGTVADYPPAAHIYSQGDPSDTILYIHKGSVKLSAVSRAGKEAVVGILGRGEFFGEGALAGQRLRVGTATAMTVSKIRSVPKHEMIQLLHKRHALSDCFIAHILARNRRLEADLVDQLFNQVERRLARALLLLARYGKPDGPRRVLPRIPQDLLAEIVGTTRPRINIFMTKFRKLGFIDYNCHGVLEVRDTLRSAVFHDSPASESPTANSVLDERALTAEHRDGTVRG